MRGPAIGLTNQWKRVKPVNQGTNPAGVIAVRTFVLLVEDNERLLYL